MSQEQTVEQLTHQIWRIQDRIAVIQSKCKHERVEVMLRPHMMGQERSEICVICRKNLVRRVSSPNTPDGRAIASFTIEDRSQNVDVKD